MVTDILKDGMDVMRHINRRTNKEEKVTIMFSSHTPTTVCPYHIFEIQQLKKVEST